MILSAHQPAYIPWLGYFDKMRKADVFVILDDVQFERGSFVNRNRIAGPTWLTIPLSMKGHLSRTIREMETAQPWVDEHSVKLEAAYPDVVHNEWYQRWRGWMYIGEGLLWACNFTEEIASKLAIATPIVYQHTLDITGRKLELIANLCKNFGADSFLFGAEGYEAYGKGLVDYGITPLCQSFTPPDNPPLSVLHYLITLGTEGTRRLLDA